ncbi:MAG: S8 family serine peptidase [Candidatus Binatia bacterium]
MARKAAKRRKAAPAVVTKRKSAKHPLPPKIFAQASPRSIGGVSMFEAQGQIRAGTVSSFLSDEEMVQRAVARLQDAGFDVLQASALSINIAGSATTYQRAFNTKVETDERPVIKELGKKTTATFVDSPDTVMNGLISTAGTNFDDLLEGVAIEEPRYYMAASMYAPLKSYWHLRVPGDVSLATNADRAHRNGVTGKGIRVAMCDSGWFKHPYFVGRGYRVAPVTLAPGATNPTHDEVGHGTGESANIFALAPDAELLPVKMSFVNTVAAFNAAVGLSPHIITNSWGSSNQFGPLSAADQALAAAIAAAVAAGIVVVFSAGNGHWGFPGQHPDVISAGGVFMERSEALRASNYASGFMSNIYANRRVPDLSGLVGMQPKAIYLMLPLEPGDDIDGSLQGGTHPNGDETANNDGWAAFSGTSAAAPQLAGAAALVKQVCPKLTPAQVRDVLKSTARDVTAGTCSPSTGGNAATVGPDLATGHGLVDAHRATLVAKVKCLGPVIGPPTPIGVKPTPVTVQPPIAVKPPIKVQPPIAVQPPIKPIKPISPVVLPSPESQAFGAPEGAGEGSGQSALSAEEAQALEELIIGSDFDFSK